MFLTFQFPVSSLLFSERVGAKKRKIDSIYTQLNRCVRLTLVSVKHHFSVYVRDTFGVGLLGMFLM